MRIVVNDIAASSGGAMTVLKEFYRYIKENDTENEWIFLLGDNYIEETENIKVKSLPDVKNNHIKKIIFDCFTGRKIINALKPDVVFSLQNIITFGVSCPQVVYIHQPIPFQNTKKFSFFKTRERRLAVYQYLVGFFIKLSAKKANKIIVQTEWMKKAVYEKCKIQKEKVIKVLPNVKDIEFNEDINFSNNSFIYPTSTVLYKNNSCLIKAVERLEREEYKLSTFMTLSGTSPLESVKYIGVLPYKEVLEYYKSSVLVFPSYIESFGYPLAEARRAGAVIFASDCPFSHEILDGYENAYFFDYKNSDELYNLMKKSIRGEIIKKEIKINEKSYNAWHCVVDEIMVTA